MQPQTATHAGPVQGREGVPQEVVVRCPANGEYVGRVAVTSAAEVEGVAARLRAAQPAWQAMGFEGRARWLGKWRDWLLLGPQVTNYWIDNAAKFLPDESVRPWGAANAAKKLTIIYEPYQLVGVITPWNETVSTPLLDIAAALMAGCAVLSKPSEFAPLAWQAAVDGWREVGAPGVLHVVNGF